MKRPDDGRQEGAESEVKPAKVANVRPRPWSLLSRGRLRASPGRYRLIGVDLFDHWSSDFLIGDYDSLDNATEEAKARSAKYGGGGLTRYHVYSDTGEAVFSTR